MKKMKFHFPMENLPNNRFSKSIITQKKNLRLNNRYSNNIITKQEFIPRNNKISKKKMSLANKSSIHKRTVTETEMINDSLIPFSNQSILSPNYDNNPKYFLDTTNL